MKKRSDLKSTNPKDRAANNRLDLSLFPDTATAYGALAMTEGDSKYGGYNYRVGGVLASVYVAAARRHLAKWFNGQWRDEKTLVPHLASALACVAVIIDAFECGVLRDDRPPQTNLDKLLAQSEVLVAHLHSIFPNGPARYTQVTYAKKLQTKPAKMQKVQEYIATPKRRKRKRHSSKRFILR